MTHAVIYATITNFLRKHVKSKPSWWKKGNWLQKACKRLWLWILCRRRFTKVSAADLYFLIQKNWHTSVWKDLEIFQAWQTFVTNLKVMGSHFFFKCARVRACMCACVYALKKAIKPNILLSMSHLINSWSLQYRIRYWCWEEMMPPTT